MNDFKSALKDTGTYLLSSLMIFAICAFTAFAYSTAEKAIPGMMVFGGLLAFLQAIFTANGIRKHIKTLPEAERYNNRLILKTTAAGCWISMHVTIALVGVPGILLMIGAQKMIEVLYGPEPLNIIAPVAVITFYIILMLLDFARPAKKPANEAVGQEA